MIIKVLELLSSKYKMHKKNTLGDGRLEAKLTNVDMRQQNQQ